MSVYHKNISKTRCPNFTKLSLDAACDRLIPASRGDTLRTSGFVDNVIFVQLCRRRTEERVLEVTYWGQHWGWSLTSTIAFRFCVDEKSIYELASASVDCMNYV